MDKKLPGVFVNKIEKELHNNDRVYVASKDEGNVEIESDSESVSRVEEVSVLEKIRRIFASRNYIYKADVLISFLDKKEIKRIIGKNGNYLITYDNELIPIDSILDIEVIEKST